MMTRVFAIVGSGIVGLFVYLTAFMFLGSPHVAIFISGVCAFSLGIAAARDGFWRD